MQLRFRLFLFLLASAPRCIAAQAPRCADSMIAGDRVGVVHLGMAIDSVRARCSILRDTIEMDEGESVRVVYALVAHDTLRIDVQRDLVWLIDVRRPGFTTSDSIRVGIPLARFLLRRHPQVLVGEGKVFLVDRSHCGISFGLSAEAYARVPHLTEASLTRLPRSTVIDEILITGISHGSHDGRCN